MDYKVRNYFGIDFGTTKCATVGYSVIDHVPDEYKYGDDEGLPIPSAIAINKQDGTIYTGRDAWDNKSRLSESCEYITSIKTLLDSDEKKDIAGKIWTPVMAAGELFKMLKQNVYDRTGTEMNEATVAIPVGFSPKKRKNLREAAKLAGIDITAFVSEPTAAFFANYEDLKSCSIVAVFDWGGGTLDVSVLKHSDGRISELASNGMDKAGDFIDNEIAKRIHAKIARKIGREIALDDMPARARDLLLVRAERAKRALGDDDTATISMNNYGIFGVCRETLEYEWFEDIIAPVVNDAMNCLEDTIRQSGVGIANIDRIVLVGGSSNLRPLQEKLIEKYGKDKLYSPEETMWNVGQGAARFAMNPGAYYSSQSVGILLSDNSYFELLAKDTDLKEWHRSYNFGIVDSSKEARFVFSGSADIDESSDKYNTLEVPAYNFLQEKILLNAMVDEDMVFRVMAGSTMRPGQFRRVWEYSRLKCYYRLPEKMK